MSADTRPAPLAVATEAGRRLLRELVLLGLVDADTIDGFAIARQAPRGRYAIGDYAFSDRTMRQLVLSGFLEEDPAAPGWPPDHVIEDDDEAATDGLELRLTASGREYVEKWLRR